MNRLADSPDIARRVKELKYEKLRRGQSCGMQSGAGSSKCWCVGLGLNGKALPCPVVGEDLPAATAEIPL